MAPSLDEDVLRACAFVAGEAPEVDRELVALEDVADDTLGGLDVMSYGAIEAGALYMLAGYDANAAVASRTLADASVDDATAEAPAVEYAVGCIRSLFALRRPPTEDLEAPPEDLPLDAQVRWECWRRIGLALSAHVSWLREPGVVDADPQTSLRELGVALHEAQRHADIAHLALLLAEAVTRTHRRALRGVPGPAGDQRVWAEYLASRAAGRPLLWPAAERYSGQVLPDLRRHAVVAVPTGAGKSSVAELAIAHVLTEGWVLYLAPTNALVTQVLRDLDSRFGRIEGVAVRAFLGGAEYTELEGEAVGDIEDGQILVMTPEKCSLALRQAPAAFERLRLLVMDECHLLADPGSRGVVAELVVAEVLHRARRAAALLLSALVSNASELAAWLHGATGVEAVPIDDPWRPTRTVRAILGVDPNRADQPASEAVEFLRQHPTRRNRNFEAPLSLLANLQGAWQEVTRRTTWTIPMDLTATLTVRRDNDGSIRPVETGYVNETAGRLTHRLASAGHRVITFLPANKHYSFSVAQATDDLEPLPRPQARLEVIDALLDLADYELGVATLLRDLIAHGVAVHTSAMLRDEQRASELAFLLDNQARAIFATTALCPEVSTFPRRPSSLAARASGTIRTCRSHFARNEHDPSS